MYVVYPERLNRYLGICGCRSVRWEWEAQWAEEIMDRDPARESELPNMNMAGEDERCKVDERRDGKQWPLVCIACPKTKLRSCLGKNSPHALSISNLL